MAAALLVQPAWAKIPATFAVFLTYAVLDYHVRCQECGERVSRRRFTLFGERWPYYAPPLKPVCSKCGASLWEGPALSGGLFRTWQPEFTSRQWRIIWFMAAASNLVFGSSSWYSGDTVLGAYSFGCATASILAFLMWPRHRRGPV